MDLGLAGKKAVIIGGTKGIGRATAERLAKEGADLAVCARTAEGVTETVDCLNRMGAKAVGGTVDVADGEALKKWVTEAAGELGGIDILVPCASAGGGKVDEEGWQLNLDVDILGTTRAIEAAMPFLKESGAGSIVVIGSSAAVEEFAAPQTYNALKGALIVHAKQLALATAGDGIRVNCVSPGPTYFDGGDWDFIKNNMPDFYNAIVAKQPFGRIGSGEEVANAIVFLASPAASWITGSNLVVDGGLTKRVQL